MADTTIREVVIRVSVESGNMKLGPIDASSAIAQLKSDLANGVGSFSTGSSSVGLPSSSKLKKMSNQDLGDLFGIDMGGMAGPPPSSPPSKPPDDDMLRQRMKAARQKERDQLRKDDEDAAKKAANQRQKEDDERMDKTVASEVKRTKREKESSRKKDKEPKSEESSITKTAEAMGRATTSALYMAKGFALVATSSDDEAESMIRAVVAIQGYMDISRGATQLITQFAAAQKTAAAAAAAGAATTVKAGAASTGAAAGTAALTGVVAGLSVPFIAVAAVVAAAVAALAYWRLSVIETRKTTEASFDASIAKMKAMAEATARLGQIQNANSQQGVSLTRGLVLSSSRIPESMRNRAATEKMSRQVESRTDLTAEQKSAQRQNFESAERARSEYRGQLDQETTLRQKLTKLKEGEKGIIDNREKMRISRTIAQGSLESAQRDIEFHPAGFFGGHTKDQKERHLDLTEKIQENTIASGKEQEQAARDLLQNRDQQLEVEAEILRKLEEQHKTVKEYQQDAYRAVQVEKERVKSHAVGLGSSDFGEINRRKIIQDKHDRIMAQKAVNKAAGRDENEGIDEYTQEEARIAIQSGDEAGITAEEQVQRTAKRSGIKIRGKDDLKDKEAEQAKRDQLGKKQTDQIEKEVPKGNADIKAASEKLATSMLDTLQLETFVNDMIRILDQIKASNILAKQKLNRWTPGP